MGEAATHGVSGTPPEKRPASEQIEAYLIDVEQSLLEASLQESQLEEALKARATVGQAVGLLMAQEGLVSEDAFQKLVRIAQDANAKLSDIAQRYVDAWEKTVKPSED